MKTFAIEVCKTATNLGQEISLEDKMEKEINIRISKAWAKFWFLKDILKGAFNLHHKSQVFNMCMIPNLTYGCQTWTLTNRNLNKIRVTQNAMEPSMLNINKRDQIRVSTMKHKLKENVDAVRYIRRMK